jgi:K+-sensing histidine kinase KdpD
LTIPDYVVLQGGLELIRNEKNEETLAYLLHDIRNWNKEIVNKAEELRVSIDTETKEDIERIFRSAEMIKFCLDWAKIELNPSQSGPNSQINIFKKIEKSIKCLKDKKDAKRLNVNLVGECRRTFQGYQNFDLAIFFLIENIIKYAPTSTSVRIDFHENADATIVKIASIGPHIRDEEKMEIFLKNKRGSNAIASGIPGSGIGLYRMKKILGQNGASISVDSIEIPGIQYGNRMGNITFVLSVPSH